MAKIRIKIEYDSCPVYEYVKVMRCFKCLGFNHKAKDCVNKIACSKCGDSHITRDCNSDRIRCVNCYDLVKKNLAEVDVNHVAFSVKCPAYQKYIQSKNNRK